MTNTVSSYISEAAASLLDDRLGLNIVPRTELVSFATPAFYYPWHVRRAANKGKALPEKIGSLQYFMQGFQGQRTGVFHGESSSLLQTHPSFFANTLYREGLSPIPLTIHRTGRETLTPSVSGAHYLSSVVRLATRMHHTTKTPRMSCYSTRTWR